MLNGVSRAFEGMSHCGDLLVPTDWKGTRWTEQLTGKKY